MNYVITGGAGNISAPLIRSLLAAGKRVTVIGRNADNLKELTQAGATAAIGSVEDVVFLTKTFKEADAIYTMIPPKWDADQWKKYIGSIGENFAAAIKGSKVKHVVNLSSVGAHMPDGCGPVSGLYLAERALNTLQGVNILHLRPAYFYQNLLSNIGLIKHAGIMGGNFSIGNNQFPIVDPSDIAAVAFEELISLKFTGHSVRYIASDEISTDAIAQTIGSAIGKPDLKWVQFPDDQAQQGMLQAGLSKEVAVNYTEMGNALHTGKMTEDYWKNRPAAFGKVKLGDFARVFAAIYAASK
ncbi:MAG TPA: NAD(P)H-binding protein [Ohtaekwangia sp.]|uniref:NmrA family NAD(P)-binding protein n=1 Tax=Ohtaekwangia sp. TaxID=2066019 RepID=UPI002F95A35F